MLSFLLFVLLFTLPPVHRDQIDLLLFENEKGEAERISSADGWERRRAHILTNMQLVMGPLPARSKLPDLDIQVLETIELKTVIRKKITFVSELTDRVPAYLMIPKGMDSRAPAMLCLHQTTRFGKAEPAGLAGLPNMHYGLELAKRGYVTIVPDYPNFGDYVFEPYENGYVSATMKGIWNHMRAVDLLQSLPEVDGAKIGCIGHSLGGHNTLFVSVFDTRIKAAVTSCGFTSFFKYYEGDLTGWSHEGYMPRIEDVYDKNPSRMPFDFPEVVAAVAPRALFVNAPLRDSNFEVSGVQDCVRAARPVYELFGAARRLVAVYPDAEHDFPPAVREEAYRFLDSVLKD